MPKIALVTGSYQGIGRGIADKLKSDGYTVIYSDVHETMDGEIYRRCDISKASDREALLSYIDAEYGRLDLLVNNAGVACKVRLDILETTEESFDRVVGINTKGTFFMCQYALPWLKQSRAGRIINIASISGRNGGFESSMSYTASKGGVIAITRGMARHLAP